MFPVNVDPELMCVKMITFHLLVSLAAVDSLIEGEIPSGLITGLIAGAGRKSAGSCIIRVTTKTTTAAIQETNKARSIL